MKPVKDELAKLRLQNEALLLANEQLKESEKWYRKLFYQANEGLILMTLDGVITDLNQSFAQMHGYTVEEMKNMNIRDLVVLSEDTMDRRAEITKRILLGETVRFEVEHCHKDGHSFVLSGTVSLITIGGTKYFLAFHQDITERKTVEKALKESEERYKQIFDNTFDIMSIYEVTEDGRFKILDFNATEEKLIGNVKNYQDRYIDECIPPELYLEFKKHYDRCIREESMIVYDEIIDFQDVHKSFNTQLIPLKNSSGRIHRIIVISRDITDLKLLTTQLQSQNDRLNLLNFDLTLAKEKAEESDRLKTAFLANMSHEIRTPMNGILGFAGLLKEPGLTGEEQQEYIRIIKKSGARMLNIISEIMDISKIESGQIGIHLRETNLNEKMATINKLLKSEAEQKGIVLSCKNGLQTRQAYAVTDSEKLYSILTNLVKNAIKYTDKGSIEFGYEIVTGNIPDLSQLRFFVKDTGIGILKERQEAIFDRFVQEDISDVQARQGAGLGLSISKAYVEMLGGKIWVQSEKGVGSTFFFTLPYLTDLRKTVDIGTDVAPENMTIPAKRLKILIAEDDETSAMYISILANSFGKEILKARTGVEAVDLCRKNPNIDLILMDIQMPRMNGYDATRQIRQFNKEVIIIAQTGFALTGDREKALAAGCNDYIEKPIKKELLISMVERLFGE